MRSRRAATFTYPMDHAFLHIQMLPNHIMEEFIQLHSNAVKAAGLMSGNVHWAETALSTGARSQPALCLVSNAAYRFVRSLRRYRDGDEEVQLDPLNIASRSLHMVWVSRRG